MWKKIILFPVNPVLIIKENADAEVGIKCTKCSFGYNQTRKAFSEMSNKSFLTSGQFRSGHLGQEVNDSILTLCFCCLLSGGAVDSTVSEPEQPLPPSPTATPAHSLHLLHLSGQGTLVQQSLSQ